LINQEIIAQEALKKGLQKNPTLAAQINLQRQEMLVNAYVQDYLKSNPISDDALKKEFERQKAVIGNKEYKARHILVDKEEEAKDAIAQIRKGASFEKLAGEKSRDQSSKVKGGELDWAVPTNYVKPFADALVRLKKGQMTESPIQSNFGWHVIRLDDERTFTPPAFDEVKPNLQRALQQQLVQKMVADLRAKAKVE
jgi:peptidyl-prolyl cis-trans isomerase C